jgi:hypothetical protein
MVFYPKYYLPSQARDPNDPVAKLYRTAYAQIPNLKSFCHQFRIKVRGPNTSEESWWRTFDYQMQRYKRGAEELPIVYKELTLLMRKSVVWDAIFPTFAEKQRECAFIENAIDLIGKASHFFRRVVVEVGSEEDRTQETILKKITSFEQIRNKYGFLPEEITTIEKGLKWELATIMNRRDRSASDATIDNPPDNKRKGVKARSSKKSLTERSNRELLIAILLEHHRFHHPEKNLNMAPISTKEARKQLNGASPATLSRTWKELGKKLNYKSYCLICTNYKALEDFLRTIDSKEGFLERSNNQEAIDYSEE